MHLFSRPEYESEFTHFLNEFKQRHLEIPEQQRAGRALLWDKAPIDLDQRQRAAASCITRGAYAYD